MISRIAQRKNGYKGNCGASRAVAVVAITGDDKLILVEQYRKALERSIVEIPAGKLEKGEDPAACAKRELEEETGYTCEELDHLISFSTSPGFCDEILHIFHAKGLKKNGKLHPDEDEFVKLTEATFEDVEEMVKNQKIFDAKTVYAYQYWQLIKTMEK